MKKLLMIVFGLMVVVGCSSHVAITEPEASLAQVNDSNIQFVQDSNEVNSNRPPVAQFGEGRPQGGLRLQNGQEGQRPFMGEGSRRMPERGMTQGLLGRLAMREVTAEVLGLTLDELAEALADGQTMPEIADAQGVSMDEVQTAVQTALNEAIDHAVAAGDMTEEQAERMRERMSMQAFMRTLHQETVQPTTAETLGLTIEELQEARQSGQTLLEIAEAQNVSLDVVRDAVEAAVTEAVTQAVADGVITQEQADHILEGSRFGAGQTPHGGPHRQITPPNQTPLIEENESGV